MPSSIPYDPSLVMANIVKNEAIQIVSQISAFQAPVDGSQEKLNTLLTAKRGREMTRTGPINLGIGTSKVSNLIEKLDSRIENGASEYAEKKIKSEEKIQPLRAKIRSVHVNMESPVDYVKTQIKSMPLASDSINLDVQYFTNDTNSQESTSLARCPTASNWVLKNLPNSILNQVLNGTAALQNATQANQGTVSQAAETACTGAQIMSMKASDVKSSLSAPSEIDDGSNKIIDINPMMTACEDHLKKTAEEMWVAKYYPGKYMAISYDNVAPSSGPPGASATGGSSAEQTAAPAAE
ncbi:uncharacterized protein EAE97_008481 [Botrytis byssoidea]|uniref:Uncharacterized protein n=1 Tax=Botrytis byssoidea TaxID=139641 RepID=A0A9P5IDA9_9HELO|nr:uncharacterized protein EAE97_008481 [Botrytis byssoidea]KAF7934121.1 hypothetical protein EAE97_008481 [Botrytis byssoidea]